MNSNSGEVERRKAKTSTLQHLCCFNKDRSTLLPLNIFLGISESTAGPSIVSLNSQDVDKEHRSIPNT